MKVAISFVDTADVAAKPQDRLRFSFGGAAAQNSDITRCNYDTALCSALWRLKAFNAYDVRKCLEIAMNKNSLAFKAPCALKMVM